MNPAEIAERPAWRGELEAICRAVEAGSPEGFFFAGELFAPPAAEGDRRAWAEQRLLQLLYENCYTRRLGGGEEAVPAPPDPFFAQRLVAANPGREGWDAGWEALAWEASGRLLAGKGGSRRQFAPGRYLAAGAAPGSPVTVWRANGSLDLQPGFYHVFSETLGESQSPDDLLRFYFNVRAASAPLLLGLLAERLNRFEVPFSFKTLSSPESYARRRDAAVLYLGRPFFAVAARLCAELAPRWAGALEPATPLFTKSLGPGIGVAEDPGNGDSFGLSRCRLLATALLRQDGPPPAGPTDRLGAIARCFAEHGLDLERPHLNPGSADRYLPPAREAGPR